MPDAGRVAAALTGILDDIREGAESEIIHPDDECGFEAGGSCTPHAALALVAAVEAALEFADECDEMVRLLDTEAEPVKGAFRFRARAYDSCAKTLREAIGAALTGTQPGEDENRG